jgi:N-acyl-D-aspartate/D-glutamate deacylase
MSMAPGERLAALRDDSLRSQLAEADMRAPAESMWILPDGDARYDCADTDNLAMLAAQAGKTPAEVFIDRCLAPDAQVNLNHPILNQSLDAVQSMLDDPMITLGLADAGAHVGQIMDSSQPTFYLTYWVRERERWTLEEAVRRLTSDTADLFGIAGRGRLVEGNHADVNVIDFENLSLPQPEYVFDFPNGAGRYIQGASGYDYTIVNGEVFMDHGEHTGAFAGQTLRS